MKGLKNRGWSVRLREVAEMFLGKGQQAFPGLGGRSTRPRCQMQDVAGKRGGCGQGRELGENLPMRVPPLPCH